MKDSHQATALVSIDLSAAFDLVDHDILVKRQDNYFEFGATALNWFKSFLVDISQCVILGNARSKSIPVLQGVPQGSVLGARLYTLHVHPMSEICKRHDIHCGCLHRTGMLEVCNKVKAIIMFTDVYLFDIMYYAET